ncbi:O-antigen ligase family protein [Peterkaempfera bronchialis]|uniref:O-antigen ligase family protein n=1 Tax=Peterkaempfera bronchialis TaxID=2126346 RepID=UPI0013B3C1AC|nr:O-antigen ligase family protein [Peterkaempfera bronchialis]
MTATTPALRDLLRRPSLAAAATVLLVCLPGGEKDLAATAAVHITPADLASLALVAVIAVPLLRGRLPVALHPLGCLLYGAVALAASVATATATAPDPAAALSGYARLVQVFVLVPVAVLLSLRDRFDLHLLLGALITAALIEGGIGVHQYLTGTGASYTGLPIRAVGTFGALDVMAMSGMVSFGLLAALALALGLRGSPAHRLPRRALYTAAALLTLPLAFSFSRGSWIACAVATAVLLLRTDPRLALRWAAVGVAGAVVLIGGFGVAADSLTERLASIATVSHTPDQSVTDRYDLWTTAGRIWLDHPATGAGPRGFAQQRDSHAPLRLSSAGDAEDGTIGFRREPLLSPHNMYLLVLSEQGLLGILAHTALCLVLLTRSLRRVGRRCRNGAGLAATALLVWLLADFLYADIGGPTTVLTSTILALATHWSLPPTPRPAAPPPSAPRPVASLPVASPPVASSLVAPLPVAFRPVASPPVAPLPMASRPVASSPGTSLPGVCPSAVPLPAVSPPGVSASGVCSREASPSVAFWPVVPPPEAPPAAAPRPVAPPPVASRPVASSPGTSLPGVCPSVVPLPAVSPPGVSASGVCSREASPSVAFWPVVPPPEAPRPAAPPSASPLPVAPPAAAEGAADR